jgi:hypothetical protein
MKKPIRKADAMGPKSTAPKKTYKTATGAQQYIAGKTPAERRKKISEASAAAIDKRDYAAFDMLQAAGSAAASRDIAGIVGKKAAKTNRSVKTFDRFEKKESARAKATMQKKK